MGLKELRGYSNNATTYFFFSKSSYLRKKWNAPAWWTFNSAYLSPLSHLPFVKQVHVSLLYSSLTNGFPGFGWLQYKWTLYGCRVGARVKRKTHPMNRWQHVFWELQSLPTGETNRHLSFDGGGEGVQGIQKKIVQGFLKVFLNIFWIHENF